MKSSLRNLLLSVAVLGVPAIGDAKTPPGFMSGLGFEYHGSIGGLDAWSIPGEEEIWMILPDGRHVIAGYLFNSQGRDVGSVILGIQPVDALESLGMTEDPELIPMFPEDSSVPDDSSEWSTRIQADHPGGEVSEILGSVMPGLMERPQQDREDLIQDLIAGIESATTPEEFQNSLLQWRERVTGAEALTDNLPTVAPGSRDHEDSLETILNRTLEGAGLEPRTAPQPAPEVTGSAVSDMELLNEISEELFWFPVGNPQTPPVYMFYDPACPHCARSIRNLGPRFEAGEFHLRIIMVPIISEASQGLAAAILASPDPVRTFLENSLSIARFGTSQVTPVSLDELNENILIGLERNMDFLGDYEIRGVPFFAWTGSEGPRFLSGVPAMDYNFRFWGR